MNDLIRFQPAKGPHRPVPDHPGAQILFFTGVRYQRMSEDDPRSPAPQATYAAQRQSEDGGQGSGGARPRRR